MEAEPWLDEAFTMVKEMMTPGFFPDWSLLCILIQAVTPQRVTPDLYSMKLLCHVNLIQLSHGCKLHFC